MRDLIQRCMKVPNTSESLAPSHPFPRCIIYVALIMIRLMDSKTFTVREVAERLGVAAPTVYHWVANGVLRHTRKSRRILFTDSDLVEFARSRYVPRQRIRQGQAEDVLNPLRRGPLGYAIVENKIRLIPDEARLVRFVYDVYALAGDLDWVLRFLNTRSMFPADGTPWTRKLLYALLSNPIYKGRLPIAKRKELASKVDFRREVFQPIVSRELYSRVRILLDREQRSDES
ncbi:MAG: hypothetical protein AMXMBFR84_26730 [Candidatus Hydrogenedentota bacterium]